MTKLYFLHIQFSNISIKTLSEYGNLRTTARSEHGFLRTARRPIRMEDSLKPYNNMALFVSANLHQEGNNAL